MVIIRHLVGLAAASGIVQCHNHPSKGPKDPEPFIGWTQEDLDAKWGTDWGFQGISTFAHLEHHRCLQHPGVDYDIAILGVPFDTAVTYRPGARFGPRAIRAASARQTSFRGYNPRARLNPYTSWAKVLDCGDIPVTPMDNALALRQMTEAYTQLGLRGAHAPTPSPPNPYRRHPKLISLGGDHTIALPTLRALHRVHGPISVVHLDAHLDTWHPAKYPSAWLEDPSPSSPDATPFEQSFLTHGTMFWLAHNESLIHESSSVHAGLRTRLAGPGDLEDDDAQGWLRIACDEIDELPGGPRGVAARILERVGTENPVYLSVDIDVIDPGLAPGTGTPEVGGWTSREVIALLRGLEALNVVGADVVEVSPAYDGPGEVTALAAAQVVYEILTSMVKRGMGEEGREGNGRARDEL